MKKIAKYITVSAFMLSLTACQDWLDMPSESEADSSTIFESTDRAEMTVVGAYAKLHTQELGYQLLMGTDEAASTESNSKYVVSNYDYTATATLLSGTYTAMYAAIEYSNVCIKNIPSMSASNETEQKKNNMLLGEAYAIRAYAYWNLIRFFGDVPYTDIPTSDLTTFSSPRVSRDTIYDRCIADLQKAVDLLPWYSEGMITTPERFSKNSAYGILARMALYAAGYSLRWDLSTAPYDKNTVKIAQRSDQARIKELYQIAADASKAVIDKGENTLLDDYDQIFRDLAIKEYNSETMLEYGWYGSNSVDCRTGYTNGIPTSGSSNTIFGKSGSQMIAWPTFYFEYDEGDQRRDVSICNYGLVIPKNSQSYQMNAWIGMGVGKYRINWKKDKGTSDSRRDINWPLLRYSDILLMYAEALNELNNGANSAAIDAVKQVRKRAFGGDESKIGVIPTGHDEFLKYIQNERHLELSNEGLRKTDLCRWGILVDHLTEAKAKLIRLANRDGEFAKVDIYRAYKLNAEPTLQDPTIALEYISMTEEDLIAMGLNDSDMKTLHTLNSNSKGYLEKTFYEADGKVYFTESQVPNGVKATAVKYTILNMYSIHTIKAKGNLSVKEDNINGLYSENSWITGSTGVFYGMRKNMVEIMPLSTNNIIDINPGLTGQQHPCYQ